MRIKGEPPPPPLPQEAKSQSRQPVDLADSNGRSTTSYTFRTTWPDPRGSLAVSCVYSFLSLALSLLEALARKYKASRLCGSARATTIAVSARLIYCRSKRLLYCIFSDKAPKGPRDVFSPIFVIHCAAQGESIDFSSFELNCLEIPCF